VNTLFYNLSLCFTKLSILLLYFRVLTYDYARKVIWVVFGIVGIYNAWGIAMYLTMCVPLAKMWDPVHNEGGYCHPWSVWWALTYLHIATDFMIFLVPVPVVVSMTIPLRQKVGLLIVFTMGLLYVVCREAFHPLAPPAADNGVQCLSYLGHPDCLVEPAALCGG
jgi:hypothetical protein